MAKELEKRGAHLICIKDMSGLLKPAAAYKLIKELKNEVGLPIHLHTHEIPAETVSLHFDGRTELSIILWTLLCMAASTSQPALNLSRCSSSKYGKKMSVNLDDIQKLSNWQYRAVYTI